MNWKTGKPNARFHVLKLLSDNFGPGDRLVETSCDQGLNLNMDLAAQAFMTSKGKKLLLINKRSRSMNVELDAAAKISRMDVVDEKSGENPARKEVSSGHHVRLAPFAVAVVAVE